MSQPLNRNAKIEARGEVDREAGEVWVDNPFMMPSEGVNLSSYERNRLFLNLSGEDFADASFTSGADIDADSRGVVAAGVAPVVRSCNHALAVRAELNLLDIEVRP